MKKFLAFVLAAVMVLSLSAVAFADAADYLQIDYNKAPNSVSNPVAPIVRSAKLADGASSSLVIITAWFERNRLSGEALDAMVKADRSLTGAKEIAKLNAELDAAANGMKLDATELFDLSLADNDPKHLPIELELEVIGLSNFVGLICYQNGTWLWVDTKVSGDVLSFTAEHTGPYAVIESVGSVTSAQTGESVPYGYVAAAMLFMAAAAWFFTKSRKADA